MNHQETIWMKKEEPDVLPDEPGLVFLEDPLKTEMPGFSIKPDPEPKSCMDSSETNVVASTRCATNSTRVVQNNSENCGISLEETPTLFVPNELKMRAEESTNFSTFDTQRRGEEEVNLFVTRLKCSRSENEFHSFSCNFCFQSFASKYRLTMHVLNHMDGLHPPPYVCKSCGEVFPSNISLNKHLKCIEGDEASSAAQMDQFERVYKHENLLLEGGRDFSVIEHTEQQSSTQRKTQSPPATETRVYKCDICGKAFTRMRSLKRHTRIHTGKQSHKCNLCGKSFTQASNLNMHLLIHTGQRPHKCNVCGKSFTQLVHLKQHTLIHSGHCPHKCTVCGKSFNRTDNLRTHALMHAGHRPHKCDVCGKTFTQLVHLKTHALMHSEQRPHKCNVCTKSFALLGQLKRHVLIHTGERPHTCLVCGKSFTELGTLKKHALMHSGHRPYNCNVCVMSFTQL